MRAINLLDEILLDVEAKPVLAGLH